MHSLAPIMGTTSVFIKTLSKTHWGKWRLLGEGRKSKPKAKSGVGFLGRGSKPHQLESGERWVKKSSGGQGSARNLKKKLFSAFRMASPDTKILYYCGSQKNEIFLTHSIFSQLLCIWWCCLMFLVYETKFTVGEWQVMVFTAGKRRGRLGEFDTWGNPPKQCRIKTTWALAQRKKLGAPGPKYWNFSFAFKYDIWKCKSRKNWKRVFFCQIELTAMEFLVQIDENEIQNCN